MEDPETEWRIEGRSSPSKQGDIDDMLGWALCKGLGLGKRAVIAGVAITSAPLVLPPLVVFSALGFAFSVPFGLILASYACTDKLMSKLLPTPNPSVAWDYYEEDKEVEEQIDDTKWGVETRIELDEMDPDVLKANVGRRVEETGNVVDIDEEAVGVEETGNVVDIDEEAVGGSSVVLKTFKNEGSVETAHPVERKTDSKEMEKPSGEMTAVPNNLEGQTEKTEGAGKPLDVGKVDNEKRRVEANSKKGGREHMPVIDFLRRRRKKKKKHLTADETAVGGGSEGSEDSATSHPNSKALERDEANDNSKDVSSDTTEESVDLPAPVILDEEKIWEKIDAMRAIVGYKSPRHGTCAGELKALCIFTGVEPPSSFKDSSPSDLCEVNAKLEFLMSIVGVKQ